MREPGRALIEGGAGSWWIRSRILLALSAALLAACGGDSTAPSALTLTPTSRTILVGGAVQLRADGAAGPIRWTSSDSSIASVAAGLVHGVAGGTATITAIAGTRHADAQVTVTRPPTISMAATAIAFRTSANGAIPAAQTVSLVNGGDESLDSLAVGTVTYAGGASDWLSATVSPTTAPATLSLQPTTASLQEGTYTATVPISSPAAANSPVVVTVTYTVGPTPVIKLGQSIAAFSAQRTGVLPDAQIIAITNAGEGSVSGLAIGTITYSSGASGWLAATINPSIAPASLTLRPTSSAIPIGAYTATVPVTSGVPGVAAAPVVVSYQVTTAPVSPSIVLASSTLAFEATAGGTVPAEQTVPVSNGGNGTLSGLAVGVTYTAGQPASWLSVTVGTTSPTNVVLQPNAVLPAGSYTAHVAVSSAVASNSPQTIAVTYTVSAPPEIALSTTSASFSSSAAEIDPTTLQILVSNTGGGSLTGLSTSIAYGAGASGWLSAVLDASAPLAPATTPLTLHVQTGSIVPGTYHATVTVSSSERGIAEQTVAVSFTRVATLSGDVQPQIFNVYCHSCHVYSPPPDGVDLTDATTSYNSLVNRPDPNNSTRLLVAPSDSLASYLYHVVNHDAVADPSTVMPLQCSVDNSQCLPAALVHLIAVWIEQGAQKDPD
ncbi:MAG TPA: Ig-like domain-containing protein [Gemmatimonadaceae bacterium]|nr:Ig-like domain-containing protein [Gemmatimonadaceae bacterium]